jgi:transcription antitermination factor NusG
MSTYCDEYHWFAFYVKPRYERVVSNILKEKGYDDFFPCYKARRRCGDRTVIVEKPLFARYVFCRCNWTARQRPTASDSAPILTTPGIIRVVAFSEVPAVIDDEEVESLRRMMNSELAVRCWPFMQAGDRVRIISGPLKGIVGILSSDGGVARVVVSITLLQRSVAVTVHPDSVLSLESAPRQFGLSMRDSGHLSFT